MEEKDMPDFLNDEKQTPSEEEKFEQAKERLNFDISSTEEGTDTVPYDFRAEHKVVADEETLPDAKSVASIRFHAIGIGVLIGVLLAVLISVFLFDNDNDNEKTAEPIVVQESKRPVKERPTTPGGMEIPDQDKTIYQKMRSDKIDTNVNIVPISEEQPVQPQIRTKEGGILGMPQNAPTSQEREWEVLNLKEKTTERKAAEQNTQEVIEQKTETVIKEVVAQEKAVAAPVIEKAKEVEPIEIKVQETPKVEAVKKAPVSQTTTKKQATTKTAATNVWHVQLSSLTSKAAAQKELPKILKAHSSLLSGLPNQIKEVNVKGKVFYRLMVGEFKNKSDAQNLCSKLKKQKQDCTITK